MTTWIRRYFSSRKQKVFWLGVAGTAGLIGFGIARIVDTTRLQRAATATAGDLDLAPFVEAVRSNMERVESDRVASGKPALFLVKDFDLELQFVVKANSSDKTGAHAEVVTVEMEREINNEASQKITLHMVLAPSQQIGVLPSAVPLSEEGSVELPAVTIKKR